MAAFQRLEWNHPDVHGIVQGRGILCVEAQAVFDCEAWLRSHDYQIVEIDFSHGISAAVSTLGSLLRWEEQFGYTLAANSRNLDALRDGYDAVMLGGKNVVLRLNGLVFAWAEDEMWCKGLLSIVSEHSLQQLACGVRHFAIVVVDAESPLIGQGIDEITISFPFRLRSNSS
ncbi:hypothetical protein ABT364_18680 [Massilia sp. SR12]